ncbi:alpha-amylase family glycosyl hydrolase [Flammeovirga kamogawensis]|uniref:Alpha-amylase n=1 Tax=Flammeovirga kamogawensis TaxID=373891 RepID=A0ABX8GYF4_9BACT|nr:alpha-amylase family glycosyl hydrolase [Flammeovirga kamogawensis]MBB6459002.1 glycosidase [Flammeovirga kamogawensis]QWG08576.1 alpha-amylase [Flammeovirga kamogawensis]TRX66868.1 alpha-amylase [Flammeovirga kamogawensis]
MIKKYASFYILLSITFGLFFTSCSSHEKKEKEKVDKLLKISSSTEKIEDHKIIIYQMMTRLFGNTTTTNKQWGTLKENGVGKFDDINDNALTSIKDLGATHVWYTGVIEHAVITDYRKYGIPLDDADVVKGRAGSPYAIKDYYDVNPDLANDVDNRVEEFEALIKRTHDNGLKVIIDFVPNHVARKYHSDKAPKGVEDLGKSDNTKVGFAPNNNFYYIPGKPFKVPNGYVPLGGDKFPTSDGKFREIPAKVSGNGAVTDAPTVNDWFETVRLNYGVNHVSGNGEKVFDVNGEVPSTWKKTLAILTYWTNKGVDGFRCDMSEMVPVEYWAWMIPQIKKINPNIRFIAEVYNPDEYKNYIFTGKFDYLYDKVGVYDSLRAVMEDRPGSSLSHLTNVWKGMDGFNNHMLRFLENHDEQRIASREFSNNPLPGIPGMAVSAALGSGPVMVYFGQEVGEPAKGESGFSGDDGRSTIFDYWGIPEHQKWVNNHKYDGGQLSDTQRTLRKRYKSLLNAAKNSEAIRKGDLIDLQQFNRTNANYDVDKTYAFIRYSENERVLVIANFENKKVLSDVIIPTEVINLIKASEDSDVKARDLISGKTINLNMKKADQNGTPIELDAYDTYYLAF